MKLTPELKNEIDTYTEGKIRSMFRFFPSDYTTGESGKYIQERARCLSESDNGSSCSSSPSTSFGSPIELRKKRK